MSQPVSSQSAALSAISPLNKGLGFIDEALEREQIAGLGWNLLKEDLSLPCAVLYQDKLRHNLEWMRQFIRAYGVKLAPHGKTTMAPRLFQMQLSRARGGSHWRRRTRRRWHGGTECAAC